MTLAIILLAVFCVAYANGANDNFKGVATLFGSGTTSYHKALCWAALTTLLGSLTAVWLAEKLLTSFSGRGLVDDALTTNPRYLAAVGLGAGCTVLLATRVGMPISTTHGLVGALLGAGWAAGSAISLASLGAQFFLPLLVSPIIAVGVTGLCYPLLHMARLRLGVTEQSCFCVGRAAVEVMPVLTHVAALQRVEQLTAALGTEVSCRQRYDGRLLGVSAASTLDRFHYLSAGAVSFARGLNDTPKIAALLLVVPLLGSFGSVALVALIIAGGGLVGARRVAETMSQKITSMNHGQGFTANCITSLIVIGASKLGLPVSTTHVSCGALVGVGAVTGRAHWGMIGKIVTAWLTTLPTGAAFGALGYWLVAAIVIG